MLYIIVALFRDDGIPELWAVGKPLSALPEKDACPKDESAGRKGTMLSICDIALYVYFCMKGYFHSYLSS